MAGIKTRPPSIKRFIKNTKKKNNNFFDKIFTKNYYLNYLKNLYKGAKKMKLITLNNFNNKTLYKIPDDTLFVEVCTQNGKTLDYNIKNGFCSCWNLNRIKKTFNFGDGTIKDFLSYAEDNKNYAKFYKIVWFYFRKTKNKK